MIGKAIYSILVNDSTVNTLSGGRIYPVKARQGTANPCIIYNEQEYPEDTKDGRAPIVHHDIQIDVYADLGGGGMSAADALVNAIKDEMDRYSGTVAGTVIQTIIFEQSIAGFDEPSDAYRITLDFRVRETASYGATTGIGTWIIETDFIVQ